MFENERSQLRQLGSVQFRVRVRAGAARTGIRGQLSDGTWKFDIAATPERGRANAALRRWLADMFGVPIDRVEILSGQTSSRKTVRVRRDVRD